MSVEVKLELGHRAVQREKQTVEGFTHDWTVFVRGSEGHDIQFFVEKVVFHLHESFHKPKRVFKEPPYSVSESGYAGFIMPIDVYFRTREEPRKVTFQYDLFLRLEGPPVSHIRVEKLTFQNPSPDFLSKLLKAGGLTSTGSGSTSLLTPACVPQHADDHQSNLPTKPSAEKKHRTHIASKEIVPKSEQAAAAAPKPSQPFTDIFGPPIRKKKSPDSSSKKSKESGHSSQTKHKSTSNSSSSVPNKEGKTSSKDKESHKPKDSHSTNKESHHPPTSKDTPSSKDKETFPPLKETHSKDKDVHPPPPKDSQSSKSHLTKDKHPIKDSHSEEGHKSKDKHHSSKSKTLKDTRLLNPKEVKASKSSKPNKESSKSSSSSSKRPVSSDLYSSHGSVEKKKKLLSPPVLSSENSNKTSTESKHKIKESKDKIKKPNKSSSNSIKKKEEKPKHQGSPKTPPSPEPKETLKPKPQNPPISPFKFPSPVVIPNSSPLPLPLKKSVDKPLSPLSKSPVLPSPVGQSFQSSTQPSSDSASMDSDSEISRSISPLSNDEKNTSDSPVSSKRKLTSDYEDDMIEQKSVQKTKKLPHNQCYNQSSGSYCKDNGAINNVPHSPDHDHSNCMINSTYRAELLELQKIIMNSDDRDLLQNIVDLIEKTGKYEITNTTFDFDLCSLEPSIIHELKVYLKKLEVNT